MLTLMPPIRIHLALMPADMRKSADGLSALMEWELGQDGHPGDLFLFRNRRCNRMKAVYWDRNGFAVWYKRLERGRFSFPPVARGRVTIYTTDARLRFDNNAVERAIRPVAVGRKSWVFAGSERGGHAAATWFTLIDFARRAGLNHYE